MLKSAIISLALAVLISVCSGQGQITQNIDMATVLPANSVACRNNSTFLTTDNSWWRTYDPIAEGVFQNFEITGITFGVEAAISGNGLGQALEIRIYRDPTAPALTPIGDLTLLYSERLIIHDTQLAVINHVFPCPVFFDVTTGDCLVVEFFAPDGQSAGNQFFIGSNSGGETDQNYLSSPVGCSITEPVPVNLLGAPSMHLLQILHWDLPGASGPQVTYPGTCEELAMFSGVNGALPTDGVGQATKTVMAGDNVELHSSSLLGKFVNEPFFILGTVVPNGTLVPDVTGPNFPGLYILPNNTFVVLGDSPIPGLVFQLPPEGAQFAFSWPGVLTGFSLVVQGVAVTSAAQNLIFASTNAHEFIGL